MRQSSHKDLVLEINPNTVNPDPESVFKTSHDAFLFVAQFVDLQGHELILNLSGGPHATFRTWNNLVGGNFVRINGSAGANPSRIGTGSDECIQIEQAGLEAIVSNVILAGGLYADFGGRIRTKSGISFEATTTDHFRSTYEGQIHVDENYSVNGGADTHIHAYSRGLIVMKDGITATLAPNLTFTHFIGVADASLVARNISVSTPFKGQSWLVQKLGFADLEHAAAAIPGRVAGETATGGVITTESGG